MFKFVVGLLAAVQVSGQTCVDIAPDTILPCDFQFHVGGCNPPYADLIDENTGLVSFCLVTCNLCDKVDLTKLDFDTSVTRDSSSFANGVFMASVEAIAEETVESYSIVSAEFGHYFTELEATTLSTDIQTAVKSTAIDLYITGKTTANVTQLAYATAVAEPVANATARIFTKITGIDQAFIPCGTIQAFSTSQFTCFSFCNIHPPTDDRTCQSYVQAGECGLIEGSCECACQTCSVGSEASISTIVDLLSTGDQEQVITAMGEAFATGAAGADAVASVFVEAIAQGNHEAVSSAIAEAFGAQGVPAIAIIESIAQAVNEGGQEVVSVVADAFASAVKDGNANALAAAISTALTTAEAVSAISNAVTLALSTAIADGECEAISYVVAEAIAISDDDFALSSVFDSFENIKNCLQGPPATVEYYDWYKQKLQSDAAIIASSLVGGNVTATAQNIARAISDGKAPTVIAGFTQALSDGAAASAVVDVVAQAMGSGNAEIVSVIARAFVAAENSNATALAEVIAEGLTSTGPAASAIAAVLSEAILAVGGCGAVKNSLEQAKSISDAVGNGVAFVNALPDAATICLGTGGIIANAIATALESNDFTNVATSAAEAFAVNETKAIMFGFIEAIKNEIDCDVVTEALASVFAEAEAAGAVSALSEQVADLQIVEECVGKGINSCRGSVQRYCCGTFPEECGCSRGRCRATKNNEKTFSALGLYVYNDIGNRLCKC